MERKIALACIEPKQSPRLIVIVIVGLLKHDRRLQRHGLGDATIDDVDNTSYRPTSVEQACWPPNNFNSIGKAHFNAFSMVRTLIRDIRCTHTILHHANAITCMTSNNWMPYSWTERSIVDTDFFF